jgi:hypothetical protein
VFTFSFMPITYHFPEVKLFLVLAEEEAKVFHAWAHFAVFRVELVPIRIQHPAVDHGQAHGERSNHEYAKRCGLVVRWRVAVDTKVCSQVPHTVHGDAIEHSKDELTTERVCEIAEQQNVLD